MKKETFYNLDVFVEVESWYGGYAIKRILANNVSEELFADIKEDPKRDYLMFGVKNVTYVRILVSKKEVFFRKDKKITIETSMVDYIEDGELLGKYSDEFMDEVELDPEFITIS
jgi:hypothetical protein